MQVPWGPETPSTESDEVAVLAVEGEVKELARTLRRSLPRIDPYLRELCWEFEPRDRVQLLALALCLGFIDLDAVGVEEDGTLPRP